MTRQWAMRASAAVLVLAALCILSLLVAGLARAFVSSPSSGPPLAKQSAEQETQIIPVSVPIQTPVKTPTKTEAAEQASAQQAPLHGSFVVKRILKIDEPFVHGYYKWDDEGVPDGEIVITVDLKAESISVFKGGYEIGAAVITFGDALKPTPTGIFPITQKSADHISNIYGTPMPYMLRLTNDGIAIHGTEVKWGWGTRGCIGVPTEFARLLFEQVKLGDRVIVTNGKMMQIG